jgi:hypothetical protein
MYNMPKGENMKSKKFWGLLIIISIIYPSTVSAKEVIPSSKEEFTQVEVSESENLNPPLENSEHNVSDMINSTKNQISEESNKDHQLSEDIKDYNDKDEITDGVTNSQENYSLATFSTTGSWIQEGGRW